MNRKLRRLVLAGVLIAGGVTAYAIQCLGGVRMYRIRSSDGSTEYVICTGAGGNCTSGTWYQWAQNGCGT